MSLRTRFLIYIVGVLSVLIALVVVAAEIVLRDSVARIESAEMHRNLERLELVRGDAQADLEGVAKDYAAWDDAFEFIDSGGDRFVRSNLGDQTFRNLRVNIILFVNASGRLIFGKAFDLERNREIPLSPELARAFGAASPFLRRGGLGDGLSGLLLLPDTPLLLSAQPILPSDGRGASRGTLVMGRMLTEAAVAKLGTSAQLDLQMHRLDRPLPDEARTAQAGGASETILPLDEQTLAGFLVWRDLYGKPALLAQVTGVRSSNLLGRAAVWWFLTAFVLVAFAAALLVVVGVEQLAIAPLLRLSRDVRRVGAQGDSSGRIPVTAGADEMARLSRSINETFAALQRSRLALENSEMRYRRVLETARDVIYTLQDDAQGVPRLTSIYGSFESTTGIPREQWIGRAVEEMVHPDDVALAVEMYRCVLNGDVPPPFELRIRTADGEYIAGEIICTPLVENGRIVGQQGAIRDLSPRKRLEAQLMAVAFASERFLRAADWERVIGAVLAHLGTAAEVSRVTLFEEHDQEGGGRAVSQQHEWVAPGIAPQINNPRLQNIPLSGMWARWSGILGTGEPIYGLVSEFPEGEREYLGAQGIRSLIVMPIVAGGRHWGTIGFEDHAGERIWTETERGAVRAAANAIGAAIGRGEAETARTRARRDLALLNELTRAALQARDSRAVWQLLANRLSEFINADACHMLWWDERQQTVVPMATTDRRATEMERTQPRPGEQSFTLALLEQRAVIAIEDASQSPLLGPHAAAQYPARSLLGLPLIAGETRLGAALLAFHAARTFRPEELALGEQVAEHFSLLLARARLLEETNRRAGELTALRDVALDITTAQALPLLLRKILERSTGLLNTDSGGLYVREPGQSHVTCVVSTGADRDYTGLVLQFGEGAAGTIAESGEPLIIDDYWSWSRRADAFHAESSFNSFVGVPLKWQDTVTGVIIVSARDQRYTQADVELLSLFAEQASIAVENARLFAEVERLAITDDLTGIYNRRYLIRALEREVARARRFDHAVSLFMLDLDHFKNVNDRFGHQAGDGVLRAVAERVRANIREIDLVARYGGEEFVVIVPEADAEAARLAAERLRQCIAATPLPVGGVPIEMTASIGVATLSADDRDATALIWLADAALYEAKNSGRNRVVVAA